jgi:prepilin-type N-terminal cleavage/methylation domain-containing protein
MFSGVEDGDREAGFTLIEILVALVILSVTVVTFISVMASLTLATEHHRGQGAVDTVVRDYAEAVKSKAITATTTVKCPLASDLAPTSFTYDTTKFSAPTIDQVEYWIPSAADPQTGTFETDRLKCTNPSPSNLGYYERLCGTDTRPECDPGLQRVTVSVTVLASAQNLRGSKTTTQVLVRRVNP